MRLSYLLPMNRDAQEEGYIYLVQNIMTGNYKIGYSRTPDKRLQDLQVGNDCELYILALIPGDMSKEEMLHQHFSEWRIRGEWFKPHYTIASYFGIK